jgi:branched-chain amino acid transport system substrate-binding protein
VKPFRVQSLGRPGPAWRSGPARRSGPGRRGRGGPAVALLLAAALLAAACTGGDDPVRIGAIYPLSGSQSVGGIEEFRGVKVAAELVNRQGGVRGRPIQLDQVDVPVAEAAPGAVAQLADRGIDLLLGSYGSTISSPAANAAAGSGRLFWETGAVGKMAGAETGDRVFRMAPTGGVLGRSAISFVAEQLAPKLGRLPGSLRWAVVSVDDVYGEAVAEGALGELRRRGLRVVGEFAYDANRYDAKATVRRIAATRPDVLFVVAYLEDGVALRRETVRQGLPLLASIGTSSSYCMPEFGAELGRDAVGLFASDKPDTHGINPKGLAPEARTLLTEADTAYKAAYGTSMTAPALAGFAGAWALFHHVLPNAETMKPADVAAAARAVKVPRGALPNGSGMNFGQSGTLDAGANLNASSVIWQWAGVNRREVVWPPQFATAPLNALPIAR